MSLPLFDRLTSGATFSECRRYRYALWRIWMLGRPVVNFVMLNPSTATEVDNDPTVERCERRARQWGYGGLIVTNIFAWRSTASAALREVPDPVGPENDGHILLMAHRASMIVCAWGGNGRYLDRGAKVRRLLGGIKPLHYLRMSERTGEPFHPLYLPYECEPQVWR